MVQWNYQEIEIANPSFEGDYQNQGGQFVAKGWQRWHFSGAPPQEESQGPCVEPEYKPLKRAEFPYRVTDGETAQCWFAAYKVMDGGLRQYVTLPTPRPEFLQFSIDAQAWSSKDNDPRRSEGEMYAALGIDPFGRGTDAKELGILWSPWWPLGAQYQRIDGPIVKVYSDIVTLFIRAWPKWRFTHNDVIVDNAKLEGISFTDDGEGPPPPPAGTVDYDEIEARVARQLARLRLGVE